jgi:PII-like signaling protein
MLSVGKAIKVSIYLSEGATRHGVSTYAGVLDYLFFRGVSGATVLKGVAGFGADHHIHSSSFVEISDHLPVKIEFIESREKVDEILGKLEQLVGSGLIELQETTVAKPAQTAQKEDLPVEHVRMAGTAKLMRIYIDEADKWGNKPLYEALLAALRANDLAGATVYRGILGYGADRKIHKEGPFHLSHDCSVMISVIDTEEKIQGILEVLDKMVQRGFVVMSDVDVIKYAPRAVESAKNGDGR